MKVIAPGSLVKLGPGPKAPTGIVLSVIIGHANSINYCVAWWNDNVRIEQTLTADEVAPSKDAPPLTIGFTNEAARPV